MSTDDERSILEAVAAGELTPEEGVARLDELRAGSAGPLGDVAGDDDPAPREESRPARWAAPADSESGPAQAIRISALAGTIQVKGDRSVAEATVDGDHSMHRDGDVLVIESELGEDGLEGASAFVVGLGPGLRRFGIGRAGSRARRPLRIRMNPDLPLEVSVSAGSLQVRGVESEIRCEVAAGNARIDGVRSPIDCSVSAGSLAVRGVLDHGDSRITCDAGSVKVDLEPGSSVEVTLSANLGRVAVLTGSGGPEHTGRAFGDERRVVIGDGAGRLDVRANLGKILVSASD